MIDDAPVVTVWRSTGSDWVDTGHLNEYDSLSWKPTFNDLGSWSISIPWGEQASVLIGNQGGLVTIDWRGFRSTWGYTEPKVAFDEETGLDIVTVDGAAALERLGWEQAWPDPSADINSQPVLTDTDPAPYKGAAETVIKQLVSENMVTRRGEALVVPGSTGLGGTATARPQFEGLLELVQGIANVNGLGVALNLVDSTPSHADLTLQVWKPTDRTATTLLTTEAGTLEAWELPATAPTATKAIVAGGGTGGVDRIRQVVTTPDSEAAAVAWGGHRVIFVDGPSSFDPDELTQAGQEALLQGAATQHLVVTTADVEGQQAFRDYQPGDVVPYSVAEGTPGSAAISSIPVTIDDQGVTVGATVGDPDASDPEIQLAETVRQLARGLRKQERR